MEQLQNVLEIVKKHHFWILSALVLLVALATYTLAVGKVEETRVARKSKVDGAFSKAQAVAGEPDHPNTERIGNWKKLLTEQQQNVLKGWDSLYQKQQAENPWPILADQMKAIGPTGEIPPTYRDVYQNFIKAAIPKLFESVKFQYYELPAPDAEGAEGAATPAPAPVAMYRHGAMDTRAQEKGELKGIVEWPEAARDAIITLFDFKTRPSTFRVRLAHEDYCVYKALLKIISQTNGDPKTQSAAAIKAIEALEIGKTAADMMKSGTVVDLLGYAVANAPAGSVTPGVMSPSTISPGGEMSPQPMNSEGAATGEMAQLTPEEVELLADRYVNDDLMPLPAGQHPYSEFKMMPVLMRLKINQRNIPDLLAECANSTMLVEVKQLRFNPESGGGTVTGGHTGTAANVTGSPTVQENPNVVSIELRGIIYLYNPPDKTKLGTGSLAEQATGDTAPSPEGATSTDSTTPAAPAMP